MNLRSVTLLCLILHIYAMLLDDPEKCILSQSDCDQGRHCNQEVFDSSCMKSRIPTIWEVGLSPQNSKEKNIYLAHFNKIICCMKCCSENLIYFHGLRNTEYIVNETNLDIAIYNDYIQIGSEYSASNAMGSPSEIYRLIKPKIAEPPENRMSSALLSTSNLVRLSKQLYLQGSGLLPTIVGQGGVFKLVSIITDKDSVWTEIKGRRIILLNPYPKCPKRGMLVNALRRVSFFKNPGVSELFTQQLPCLEDPKHENNAKDISFQKALETDLMFIKTRHRLIPSGVRDSYLFEDVLHNLNLSSSEYHQRTIDCTCAAQFADGRALIKRLYDEYNKVSTDGADIVRCEVYGRQVSSDGIIAVNEQTKNLERDVSWTVANDGSIKVRPAALLKSGSTLRQYYSKLPNYKYSLSPSSERFLSPCEWEAIAFGVIPVVQFPFIAFTTNTSYSYLKSVVDRLYENTPILRVPSWSSSVVTERSLLEEYERINIRFSSSKEYSTSKVYLFYWLHAFSKYLLTAKPSSRFFSPMHEQWNRIPSTDGKCKVGDNTVSKPDPIIGIKHKLNHQKSVVSSFPTKPEPTLVPFVELVVPRCCENGFEFKWLFDFVRIANPEIGISIYYKCPMCLPKSLARNWIENVISRDDTLVKKVKHGYRLLEDDLFVGTQSKLFIRQEHAFDRVYNGKEVTAYLKHILTRYHSLANQTIFLHSLPHAHISFQMFYRLLKYNLQCRLPVYFMHLNVNYKFGPWGSCCGDESKCQLSTWQYLFGDNSVFGNGLLNAHREKKLDVSTYSSAQFAVSREAIHSRDITFYNRMTMAINGSRDLDGCDDGSSEGPWGGHRLTGQYERIWHVIYGQPLKQPLRKNDKKLPAYLRQGAVNIGDDDLGAV